MPPRPFLGIVLLTLLAVPSALTQANGARIGSPPRGRVVTVLGDISPDSVGVALMHEHLAINMLAPDSARGYLPGTPPTMELVRRLQESGRYFRVPRTAEQLAFWNRPDIAPDMVDRLTAGSLTRSNFIIDGSGPLEELAAFRRGGGRTVVDVTTMGIGRDPIRLRDLARQSGVNVVMGTGWYRWMFHPAEVARSTVEQLADVMIREITIGVGTTGVRAGIIGEIPVDAAGLRLAPPIDSVYSDSAIVARRAAVQARIRSGRETPATIYDPAELKVLRAAARASRRTGAAITLHAPDPWIDYLDVLAEEGADLSRVVIGHADYVMLDSVLAARAFARGVFPARLHPPAVCRPGPRTVRAAARPDRGGGPGGPRCPAAGVAGPLLPTGPVPVRRRRVRHAGGANHSGVAPPGSERSRDPPDSGRQSPPGPHPRSVNPALTRRLRTESNSEVRGRGEMVPA